MRMRTGVDNSLKNSIVVHWISNRTRYRHVRALGDTILTITFAKDIAKAGFNEGGIFFVKYVRI